MKRRWLFAAALALGATNLLPLWLVVKQALSPEKESFSWPPHFFPQEWTLANLAAAAEVVPLGGGLLMSLGVAGATVLSSLLLALPAAFAAARRPPLDGPLDVAFVAARMLPTIAVAIPLAVIFVGAGLYNSPFGIGLWLAHTLLGLPFAFLVLRAAFRGVPRELEEAARLDGATSRQAFWRISLPLVRPSLATAAVLVFLVSWDEFAYAILLQVTNRSLPPLLYYLSAFGYPGLSSAVALLMLVPAVVIVLLLEPVLRSGVLAGSHR
ncbi:MAG: carbohydrate ABC transporter permease [bacterium]